MAEFQSIDDFVNYRSSEGGGGKRLKSWKKDKGILNFWLHTKQMPARCWNHQIPELVVRTDRDTQVTKKNVWGRQFVCHEDEEVLKKQRFRDRQTGARELPPRSCGQCRLQEAVYQAIWSGKLDDTEILFRWEGADDAKENRIVHAGGLCGYWKREMPDAQAARLANAGIYMKTAWSENMLAKLKYVFVGVNQDDVASEVQTTLETELVGQKVQKLIRDQIASEPGNLGNPILSPYCIQIYYSPQEPQFNEKYGARRVNRYPLTPEIEKLIRSDPPTIAHYLKPFDPTKLRAMLEQYATPICKKVLDWDAIWNVPNPIRRPPPEEPRRAPETSSAPPASALDRFPTVEYDDPCDDCKAPMLKGATKCTNCGASYEATPDVQAVPNPVKSSQTGQVLEGVLDDDSAVYDDEVPF